MIDPLYCTTCGIEIGEGCECAERVFWSGPYCEFTGRENCDCSYCKADAAGEDEE